MYTEQIFNSLQKDDLLHILRVHFLKEVSTKMERPTERSINVKMAKKFRKEQKKSKKSSHICELEGYLILTLNSAKFISVQAPEKQVNEPDVQLDEPVDDW